MYTDKDLVYKKVGAKIAYYRKIRHLKQSELAELTHVSTSMIGRIERGQYNHNVPLSILIDISHSLQIDMVWLITFEKTELLPSKKEYTR